MRLRQVKLGGVKYPVIYRALGDDQMGEFIAGGSCPSIEINNILDDDNTAAAILRDLVRERSSVVLTLEYEADPSWGWLPLGGAVALTDAGMFYTDQLGEIAAKRWSGTRWLFSILFLLDSARDNRA